MFYFTPLAGFFSPFPRGTFAIGHLGIFSLTRWSSQIHTEFHVLHATRDETALILSFRLQGYHFLRLFIPQDSSNFIFNAFWFSHYPNF